MENLERNQGQTQGADPGAGPGADPGSDPGGSSRDSSKGRSSGRESWNPDPVVLRWSTPHSDQRVLKIRSSSQNLGLSDFTEDFGLLRFGAPGGSRPAQSTKFGMHPCSRAPASTNKRGAGGLQTTCSPVWMRGLPAHKQTPVSVDEFLQNIESFWVQRQREPDLASKRPEPFVQKSLAAVVSLFLNICL